MTCRRTILTVAILLITGAALNVAVAWGSFPGYPQGMNIISHMLAPDVGELKAAGVPQYLRVDREALRTFGFFDREYSTILPPNQYPLVYARETSCGWPCLALHGIRWAPLAFDEQRNLHRFTGENIYVTALQVSNDQVMLGEREYLPFGPLWPGFAINTLFYAGVLWVLFAGPFALRRMIRRRRGLCPACAYPIGTSEVCTECGAAKRVPR